MKIAMSKEFNELLIARNENIRWAQYPKYQKAVSVNRNEANIPKSLVHDCQLREFQVH